MASAAAVSVLADAEHAAALVDAAEHVAVLQEAEAAEHAPFLDVRQFGQIGAQQLGQSFVIGHGGASLVLDGAES